MYQTTLDMSLVLNRLLSEGETVHRGKTDLVLVAEILGHARLETTRR
ncbi:hypothetical protein [Nonomuraea dietziae]